MRIEEDGAYSSLVAQRPRGSSSADGADIDELSPAPAAAVAADADAARLATQLVATTTVWRRRLESLLRHFYDGGAGTLEPTVRMVRSLSPPAASLSLEGGRCDDIPYA